MSLKNIYDKVSNILQKQIELNKQASCAMQFLGYNGFKRLHRCNSMCFYKLQMKLANHLFNLEQERLSLEPINLTYNPISLKDHLKKWIDEIDNSLKELGELNRQHFETFGICSDIIEETMCLLIHDLGKARRWYAQSNATDWLEMYSFILDEQIHKKYKKKEYEENARIS